MERYTFVQLSSQAVDRRGAEGSARSLRCLVSEIVGINVPTEFAEAGNTPSALLARSGDILRFVEKTSGRRMGSRIDPLGVLRKVEVFKSPEGLGHREGACRQGR
ncbi:MAG: hypothetical protein WCB44_28795 [Stellaceae bacterium]